MTKKKILVLTDHMPWGHRSIAKAIFNYLKENKNEDFEIYYAEIKSKTGPAGDLYVFTYRYLPASNRLAHKISRNQIVKDLIEKSSEVNLPLIKKEVERIKPDLIISAYFFHTHSLARWREETGQKFKLWTVATDPWTINPIMFVKGVDLFLVYDEIGQQEALNAGIKIENIVQTGWWVRPEMYQKYDRNKIRKNLGFNDDRPIIFVGGGSLGTNSITKLLPILFSLKTKVGFVFNTGTDKLVYNLVNQYIKMFRQLRKDDLVQIKHLGWIENIAEVLSACDMVFGKAGPNFLFDVMACQKPFVAITHIGGQEDGNIDLIKKKNLGWVKEKNEELVNFLFKYLKDPKIYQNKFLENIKKEAELNQKSLPKILELIKKES
ncbi:MAG: glycosyltransferase [Candidatus Shapirobacteria bacterium]|jgi:UDP-N-acetylglucosamine:LPS N-acetylglucosamine transferase